MDYSASMMTCVLIIGMLAVPSKCQHEDITLVEGAYGQVVVEAVLNKFHERSIYSDSLFLRRLAHAQSVNGTHPLTYRPGYNGGIWQIDLDMFSSTRDCQSPAINGHCGHIYKNLMIDWSNSTWIALRKPLYSGLAALLYTLLKLNGTVMSDDIQQQYALWVDVFRKTAQNDFTLKKTLMYFDTAVEITSSENNGKDELTLKRFKQTAKPTQVRTRRSSSRLIRKADGCHAAFPAQDVRLVNGSNPWLGQVEVMYNGLWMPVCYTNFGVNDAKVVCQKLGFLRVQSSVHIIALENPATQNSCDHSETIVINCLPHAPSPPVRLNSNASKYEGLLEIWYNGSWGPVCNDSFDINDTQRVCGILGYTSETTTSEENEPIRLNDLKCKATGQNLIFCRHNLSVHDCNNETAVYINCNTFTKESVCFPDARLIYYVGGGALCVFILILSINCIIISKRTQAKRHEERTEAMNEMDLISTSEPVSLREFGVQREHAFSNDYVERTPGPGYEARKPVFPSEVADLNFSSESCMSSY